MEYVKKILLFLSLCIISNWLIKVNKIKVMLAISKNYFRAS